MIFAIPVFTEVNAFVFLMVKWCDSWLHSNMLMALKLYSVLEDMGLNLSACYPRKY